MKKLLLGLAAVFALTTALPAFPADEGAAPDEGAAGADKTAPEKAPKKGKKGKKGKKDKDAPPPADATK